MNMIKIGTCSLYFVLKINENNENLQLKKEQKHYEN